MSEIVAVVVVAVVVVVDAVAVVHRSCGLAIVSSHLGSKSIVVIHVSWTSNAVASDLMAGCRLKCCQFSLATNRGAWDKASC
jgi:hypothetical protein